jgi:hypothetical protein
MLQERNLRGSGDGSAMIITWAGMVNYTGMHSMRRHRYNSLMVIAVAYEIDIRLDQIVDILPTAPQ